MFAKLEQDLPKKWLYFGVLLALSCMMAMPSYASFFLGFLAVFISSLLAQIVLSLPYPGLGIQRYWRQLISAQACKLLVFGIIIYSTISYKFIDGNLFLGVIVAQLTVFWNYRKYG